MKRLAAICWMITATLAVTMVFQISSEVQKLQVELKAMERDTAIHEEAVRVLQAEWSYLNRPAHIADLAKRHLDLRPLTAEQFIDLENLPLRPGTEPQAREGLVRHSGPTATPTATLVATESTQ